jgi:hypothetical protein
VNCEELFTLENYLASPLSKDRAVKVIMQDNLKLSPSLLKALEDSTDIIGTAENLNNMIDIYGEDQINADIEELNTIVSKKNYFEVLENLLDCTVWVYPIDFKHVCELLKINVNIWNFSSKSWTSYKLDDNFKTYYFANIEGNLEVLREAQQ